MKAHVALAKLNDDGQHASMRLLLAERGLIILSTKEKNNLAAYGREWLARYELLLRRQDKETEDQTP